MFMGWVIGWNSGGCETAFLRGGFMDAMVGVRGRWGGYSAYLFIGNKSLLNSTNVLVAVGG